jgi:hypothetical protein
MSTVFMDGREIDTAIWIDRNIVRFKGPSLSWALRRHILLREIADYEVVLANYGQGVPSDPPGEAHTKVYLGALARVEEELMDEIGQKPRW